MMYSRMILSRVFRSALAAQLKMDPDQFEGTKTLSELGLDFLGLLEVVGAIEKSLGIRVEQGMITRSFTVDEGVTWLEDVVRTNTGSFVVAEGAD